MTNKSNSNQPEKECIPCSAYQYFLRLAKTTDIEEAFHDAMNYVVENLIEELDEAGLDEFQDGYKVGYLEAFKTISEQINKTAEMIEDMNSSPCDDCDCEEGYCEIEDNGTNYKMDETVEDKIRNAIRKD